MGHSDLLYAQFSMKSRLATDSSHFRWLGTRDDDRHVQRVPDCTACFSHREHDKGNALQCFFLRRLALLILTADKFCSA